MTATATTVPPAGQNVGYIRVSTADQHTARQLDGIKLDRVFEDHASGKDMKRPAWAECRTYLRAGDTLHVHSIDRLARSTGDLLTTVEDLRARGVAVVFHKENLVFSSGEADPRNLLMLNMLAALAQFERAIILERQREGIALAKASGRYASPRRGTHSSLTAEQQRELVRRKGEGATVVSLARDYGVSRQTVYAVLKDAAAE